jgi:hypothetical protein
MTVASILFFGLAPVIANGTILITVISFNFAYTHRIVTYAFLTKAPQSKAFSV